MANNLNKEAADKNNEVTQESFRRMGFEEARRQIKEWGRKNDESVPLGLNYLDLGMLPEELFDLENLRFVELRSNDLHEIPKEIGKLKKLQTIDLSHNKLTELPDALFDLENLQTLELAFNRLRRLPKEIKKLKNLFSLDVGGNGLEELPDEIGDLHELIILGLGPNKLQALPDGFFRLVGLRNLGVTNNPLKILSEKIGLLKELRHLFLVGTQITGLPAEIGQLKNLESLSITSNPITRLPEEIKALTNLRSFYVENTGINFPEEIRQQADNPQTIINYYFENLHEAKEEDLRPLKEVKVLLVGQGRVGKTSLVKYLIEDEKCNPEEPSTHGIIRNKWQVEVVENKTQKPQTVQLNIWDFGGQDIQHQTHQFFLNQRSLYLLVLDAGRDEAGNKLDYWLKKIETVGRSAPILIAVNKSEQCLLPLAYTELENKFNIKGFFNVSCENGREIEALRQAIRDEIGKIENVFEPIRKEWFAVKDHLENLEEDYISRDEYRRICREKGVTDAQSQDTLLILLHELGVMLNFKEHETEVLNPEWVTRGVYQVVTSLDVQANKGVLTPELLDAEINKLREQLNREGKNYLRYPVEKYSFITDLMREFELAYRIDETKNFFVPSLLPKDSPYVGEWDEKQCLGFRYNYENGLLHETIMSRFIVRMHRHILDKTQWLTGVLLQNEYGNKALVKADLSNGYLTILIDGNYSTRRVFLGIIRDKFRDIQKDNRPIEEVPLREYPGVFVKYELLLGLEKEGIEVSHTDTDGEIIYYNVRDLLNGVSTPTNREEERRRKEEKYLEKTYQDGLKEGRSQAREDSAEIDEIVAPYIDENASTPAKGDERPVAGARPTLFKTMATFVAAFIFIMASIGFYDYLQKQGYLSENGFYLALVFTVVFIVVMATFALAAIGIIPAEKIPDILKPALGLVNVNQAPNKSAEITKK